jgi:uncharacterized coiled-coil DUF342 family protein
MTTRKWLAELAAAKEKIDTLWIQSADRAAKIDSLTAENAALKEGLDGWHSRFLDCEVERDVEKEHVRQCVAHTAKLVAERDALAARVAELTAELGDLPESQREMMAEIKQLKAELASSRVGFTKVSPYEPGSRGRFSI